MFKSMTLQNRLRLLISIIVIGKGLLYLHLWYMWGRTTPQIAHTIGESWTILTSRLPVFSLTDLVHHLCPVSPLSSVLPSNFHFPCQSQLPQQRWCLSILGECRHTPKLLNGQAKNSSGWIWLGWFMRLWVIQCAAVWEEQGNTVNEHKEEKNKTLFAC